MKKASASKLKNDVLLFAVLLVISLLLFAGIKLLSPRGGLAVIRINGEHSESLPLFIDAEKLIETPWGSNLLTIKNGRLCITAADCPDRICVRTGEISRQGESITCLPHKLTVTIEKASDDGFDAVAN